MNAWGGRIARFGVGFLAGFAPFATMAVLPAVLSPGAEAQPTDWRALLLLSGIVGFVTVVFFERSDGAALPREVFIAALGIPTMFIGTVSNLTARYEAARTSDRASYAVERTAEVAPEPPGLQPFDPGPDSSASAWFPDLIDEAHAQVRITQAARAVGTGYLVVLGSYRDQSAAIAEYRRLQRTRLQTERYAPKLLSMFRGGDGSILVTFAQVSTEAESQRLFRLLLINDPKLSPRVIKLGR